MRIYILLNHPDLNSLSTDTLKKYRRFEYIQAKRIRTDILFKVEIKNVIKVLTSIIDEREGLC